MLDLDDLLSYSLAKKTPNRYVHSAFLEGFMKGLLAGRNEHALFLGVVSPSTGSCFTAMLFGIPFDPLLEFGSEVSYQTL